MKVHLLVVGVAAMLLLHPGGARAQVQGVSAAEIVLGTHLDLSGPISAWGQPIKSGMEMAVDDINAAGGIHGRKLRLVVEDNAYDPKKAVLATQKMLTHDRIFAVIGSLGTATSAAAMPLVLEQRLLHLFPVTPADIFFEPFYKLKFALFTPYYDDIRTGLKYIVETKGKKRIGILYQDDEFGVNILKGVKDQLQAMQLPLVASTSYKRGATDYSSQIAKLKSENVDLVVLGTIIRETIGAIAAARQLGWDVDFLTSQAAYGPEVIQLGKQLVEGLHGIGMMPVPESATASPEVAAWMRRFEQRFGRPANLQSAIGYILIETAALGFTNAGPELTPETAIAGLEKIREHRNAFGMAPISFSKDNHLGTRAVFIARVQSGKWVKLTDFIRY